GGSMGRALGDAGRQPVERADGSALVGTKRASGATLVVVTNNHEYPFAAVFTEGQRKAQFYRKFRQRGSWFFKDVRVPCRVTLSLRADLAARPPHITDVFAGTELPVRRDGKGARVEVDRAKLPGRVLLLTDGPPAAPEVTVGARADADPLATLVVRGRVPLPVRIRVAGQEVYRAA